MAIVQSLSATSMAIFYSVGVASSSSYAVQDAGWMVSDVGIYEHVEGNQITLLVDDNRGVGFNVNADNIGVYKRDESEAPNGGVDFKSQPGSILNTHYLQYGNVGVKDLPEGDVTDTPSTPDMKTMIPSVEDEDRMRESLIKMFEEKGLPTAPALNAATYLSREWIMAAAHQEWGKIPKYRPLRDGIKKRTGVRYFVGDHFEDYWRPSLDRGLLYRHFILQYDEEFAADLATHISRAKRKNPDGAIKLPKKSDYNTMLLNNIDSVMGQDAYNAINAHATRGSRRSIG